MAIGEASVRIVPDTSGFAARVKKDVDDALNGVEKSVKETTDEIDDQFKKAGKEAGEAVSGIGEEFKKLGKLVAGAAIGRAVFSFAKDAINAASDLGESINAVQVTFGDLSDEILAFSKTSAQAVGLAEADFNSFAVRFAGFTKQIATGSKDAAAVTAELTTRIADFASVMNLDLNEAATVFASTLAGESEAIRRFGIDMSAASIEAFALANGMIKSKDEMTASIKVQATYAKLMADTAQVAGDFANTSDSLANRQRILAAEFKNAQAEVGQALIPTLNTLLGVVGDVIGAFSALPDNIQTVITIIGLAGGAFLSLSSALQGVGIEAATANTALAVLAGAITVGTLLYKAWNESNKESEERQRRLTDALVAAEDPTATLTSRVQKLVDEYNRLNPEIEDAEDAIEGISGAIDFVRAETLDYLPVLKRFGGDLETVMNSVQDGTNDFEELRRAIGLLGDSAPRSGLTSEYFDDIADAISRVVDEANPMRDVLMNIARDGDMTVGAFMSLLTTLDETADAFDDNREKLNQQAEALLRSTDGARAFAGALGEDVYAKLVANAEQSGNYVQVLALVEQLLRDSGLAYDLTTGDITEFTGATDTLNVSLATEEQALNRVDEAINRLKGSLDLELTMLEAQEQIEQFRTKWATAMADGQVNANEFNKDLIQIQLMLLQLIEDVGVTATAFLRNEFRILVDTAELERAWALLQAIASGGELKVPTGPGSGDTALMSPIPRAIGGVITSPEIALIGEAGAEAVIPLTRPQRAMELMRDSGLLALAQSSGYVNRGSAVSIQTAVFNNGTDANLVAQKVNAAERARSFTT